MAAVLRQRQEPFKPHAIKVAEAARARVMNGIPAITDPDEIEAARIAEIHQWKDHVVDLHRVFSVAEAMFLLLEHNNEALLRVAIEIVCCATSQKVLWWNIGWYSDEERRAQFRAIVNGYLSKCMAYMNVQPLDTSAHDEEVRLQEEALNQAREQTEKAEASRKAMEHAKGLLEAQVRELEAALAEITAREKELQKANQSLQNELRQSVIKLQESGSDAEKLISAQLAELQAKLAASEEQKLTAMAKLEKMEAHAHKLEEELALNKKGDIEKAAQARVTEAEKRMSIEQERRSVAEKKAQESEKEIVVLKEALKKAEIEVKKAKKSAAEQTPAVQQVEADPEVIRCLEDSLEQQRRIAEEYQAELETLKQAFLQSLINSDRHGEGSSPTGERKDNSGKGVDVANANGARNQLTMESGIEDFVAEIQRLQELANKPPEKVIVERVVERTVTVESPSQQKNQDSVHLESPRPKKPKPEPVEEPEDTKKKEVGGVSQEEFDAKCRELEKAKGNNASLRGKLKELTEERDQLQERSDKMLKMLHQLKEQLKRVTAIAQKRGYGQVVDAILDEAHVTETLDSPEFTIYDRLYEDAKRRHEKHRQWEEERMGIQGRAAGARGVLRSAVLLGQAKMGINVQASPTPKRSSEPQIPSMSSTAPGGFSNFHRASAPDVPNYADGEQQGSPGPFSSTLPREASEAPTTWSSEGLEGRSFPARPSSSQSNNSLRPSLSPRGENFRQRPSSSPSKKINAQGEYGDDFTQALSVSGFGCSSEPANVFGTASEPMLRYDRPKSGQREMPALCVSGFGCSSEPVNAFGTASEPMLRYERPKSGQRGMPALNISGLGCSSEPVNAFGTASEPMLRYDRPKSGQIGMLQQRPNTSPNLDERPNSGRNNKLLQPVALPRTSSAPSLPSRQSPGQSHERATMSAMALDIHFPPTGSPRRSGSASPADFRRHNDLRTAVRTDLDPNQFLGARPGAMRGFKLRRHGKPNTFAALRRSGPNTFGLDDPLWNG